MPRPCPSRPVHLRRCRLRPRNRYELAVLTHAAMIVLGLTTVLVIGVGYRTDTRMSCRSEVCR